MLYPLYLFRMYSNSALMHMIKIVGDSGSPCLTPECTVTFDVIPCSVMISTDVFVYNDIINPIPALSNPRYLRFSLIDQCWIVSYALLRSINTVCRGFLFLLLSVITSIIVLIFKDVSM